MQGARQMKVSKVIIHHSASVDGRTQNWGEIRRYHTVNKGWLDIGYHYGIELVDYDYEVLIGRFENEKGAHCPTQNDKSLGICMVGNFQKTPVPNEQWAKCIKLVRQLMKNHNLTKADIYGHRDFRDTACPGKHFDIKKFRKEL
jgi:hypothetical protein